MSRHDTLRAAIFISLLVASAAEAKPELPSTLRALVALDPDRAPLEAIPMTNLPEKGIVVDLFLEGNLSDADLAARGILVGSRLPNGLVTAKAPVENLGDVLTIPGLTRVSAAHRNKLHHNVSVPSTLATPNFWTASPPNFTGQAGANVIVGIVDTGVDWTHGDFKNPDGTTRILNIWDQNDLVGPNPPGFGYGSHWTAANINAGTPREVDANGHGTHVTGSAAGDGSATGNGQPANQFIGMAPRADIIVVATNFSTTGVVDGVNFIFQRALALGRPAVVNLSLGNQFGAHDGTESMDTAIDALTGPGKIVVISAGNDANAQVHAEQFVPPGPAQTVTFSVPSYTANGSAGNDYILIDAYYQGSANMTVTLTSPGPSPVTVGPVAKGATGANAASLAGDIFIENGFTPSPSGDANVFIQIYDSNQFRTPRAGTWTLTFTPVSTTAGTQIDLWQAQSQLGPSGAYPVWSSDVDESELVGSPGTSTQAITVAAHVTKVTWPAIDGNTYGYVSPPAIGAIAPFSSPGPRRDGVQKPDISAPGMAVVSAKSTSAGVANSWINPDGVHFALQGTSMSSPHVTGAVALILADAPTLTPAQVKAKLYANAVTDGFTGAVPNGTWGYGKLRLIRDDAMPPTVSVTSPNGGESWIEGTGHAITWSASDNIAVTSVDIAVSTNNGGAWTNVALGEANDGAYAWTVPMAPTVQALVRVTARDAALNSSSDVSNAVFTIASADQSPPAVTVTSPNGGETWIEGSGHAITWNATDDIGVTGVDLYYSTNNGGAWISLSPGEANDGTCNWTLPATPSTQTLVRAIAHDASGKTGRDSSDAVFTILSTSASPVIPANLTRPLLFQNQPNPFNPTTVIGFALPAAAPVSLRIYTLRGALIRTLVGGSFDRGYHEVSWDGRTDSGVSASSGVYFYRFEADGTTETKRLLISK